MERKLTFSDWSSAPFEAMLLSTPVQPARKCSSVFQTVCTAGLHIVSALQFAAFRETQEDYNILLSAWSATIPKNNCCVHFLGAQVIP